MKRVPLLVANWKMHKTGKEARAYVDALADALSETACRVLLAVPFTAIEPAARAAAGSRIVIGAQNMHDELEGAFTGEISARMLKEVGAKFVLLGHSERRHHFGESDAFIHRKLQRALSEDLFPILCIGETLAEREDGVTQRTLSMQLEAALGGLDSSAAEKIAIAYEPVWAIGTGRAATPLMAQEAHHFIRGYIEHAFGKSVAEKVCLLYGGSVKPENISQLMQEPDIDGALIGGAALDPGSFAQIINY